MVRTCLSVLALVLAGGMAPAVVGAQQPAPAAQESSESARSSATVNINTATAEQLTSLPGIGPKTAERILEYRQKNGSFKKIEELMNVKGIGEKSFLKLKPRITVGTPKA
jgi:competence protein ComEA